MSKALDFPLPCSPHIRIYINPPSQSSPENITRAYLNFIHNSITEKLFVIFHNCFEVQNFLQLLGTGCNFSKR